MYDRGSLTVLPPSNSTAATGALLKMDLTAAATTEGNTPHTAGGSGVVVGILLQVVTATVYATTLCQLAVHINDVAVGYITIPTAVGTGATKLYTLTPIAGTSPAFKAGDVLKVEVKVQGAGAGLAGEGVPYIACRYDI